MNLSFDDSIFNKSLENIKGKKLRKNKKKIISKVIRQRSTDVQIFYAKLQKNNIGSLHENIE